MVNKCKPGSQIKGNKCVPKQKKINNTPYYPQSNNLGKLLIIAGILLVGYILWNGGGLDGIIPGVGEPVKEVICDIRLYNPLYIPVLQSGDIEIKEVTCRSASVDKCSLVDLFQFQSIGSVVDKTTIKLSAGGKSNSIDKSIIEGTSPLVQLNLCVKESVKSGLIETFVENKRTDYKDINFN